MKASISATRSSSIVIVTRCIASSIRVQYDDFLLTSYSRIPTVLTPIRARLAQRRYRIDRAARALEPSDGLCCGNAGGRGVLKATRWSVLAVASIFGLPQQGLAQSPTPPDAPGGPPAAGERPTGQTLPTINISTKRAKPRAKPVVTAGAPQTAPATPSVPQPPPYPPPHAGEGREGVGAGPATAPSMASQMDVTGADLNARPVTRPGEVLEAAPGLIVTQHSGEGKANQYFLRGYNLDHGTDLAITVDDMPINMRTHAHGQGYSDLNFLMPEIVNSLKVRKGPYFADVGDFGSVGALNIGLVDSTPKKTASLTVGSFSYQRLFGMASTPAGNGNLFFAGELAHYDGPWQNPDDARKVNGVVRYSQGTADNGLTVTGMAYANKWNSTDQVPLRAITSGQVDRFGEIDPTDGGNANRFSLSARIAKSDDAGWWKANFYAVRSTLDLYSNFTWFLNDHA